MQYPTAPACCCWVSSVPKCHVIRAHRGFLHLEVHPRILVGSKLSWAVSLDPGWQNIHAPLGPYSCRQLGSCTPPWPRGSL